MRRSRSRVLGASNAVTSTPTTSHSRATSPSSVAQPRVAEPAGHGELRGQDLRVEHVEVEVHVDRRPRSAADLRRARCGGTHSPGSIVARSPHAAHPRSGSKAGSKPASQRPHAAAEAHAAEEAARRRLGRVGVARARRATARARPATWRATAGNVVRQIEQSDAVSTGKRPAASISSTWPPASQQAAARVAQVVLVGGDPRLAGRRRPAAPPGRARAPAPRRRARRPRVRSDVRQRSAATLSGRPTRAPASRRTPSRPPGCRRSRARARRPRAGTRARRRSARSCWRYIASLPSRISSGDLAASRAAQSATAASNSSSGTTLLTIPIRSASARADLLAEQQQLVRLLARRRCGRSAP